MKPSDGGSTSGGIVSRELEALCREHGVDGALAAGDGGIGGLIRRVLEECESGIDAAGDGRPADPERLRALMRFVSEAAAMRGAAGRQEEREAFAELMRALGKMCHAINNPLTALMGRAQILKMRDDTDPNVKKAADVIEQAARQVAELIREMAQMVRKGRDDALRSAGDSSGETGKG